MMDRSTVVNAGPVPQVTPWMIDEALEHEPAEERAPLASDTTLVDGCCIIVFTDISGSTAIVEQLGDDLGAELFQRHTRLVRRAIAQHHGLELRSRGDGFVIVFRSVKHALGFSLQVRDSLEEHNAAYPHTPLHIRTGVHAGEPVSIDHELQGVMLHKAARIAAGAAPAEILVSDVVRQLAEGKSFEFEEPRERSLRGLTGPVKVHALRGRTGASFEGACVVLPNGSNGTGSLVPLKLVPDEPGGARTVRTRVLVAHEQRIMREGVRVLLEREGDLQVVAAVASEDEILASARSQTPDVLVLPIRPLPGSRAFHLVRRVRKMLPGAGIVALVDDPDGGGIRDALRAGIRGYLFERCSGADLVQAVRAVAHGGSFVDGRNTRALVESIRPINRVARSIDALTDREREVFQLIAEGHTTRAIAHRLGVMPKTVGTHRTQLKRKLSLRTTADLVRYAVGCGVIRADK